MRKIYLLYSPDLLEKGWRSGRREFLSGGWTIGRAMLRHGRERRSFRMARSSLENEEIPR